jgi:hypothetical protein
MLLEREATAEGKIKFMVYDNEFLAGYHNLKRSRYIPLLHMMLNTLITFIMQYFVYETYFKFKLLSPWEIST